MSTRNFCQLCLTHRAALERNESSEDSRPQATVWLGSRSSCQAEDVDVLEIHNYSKSTRMLYKDPSKEVIWGEDDGRGK